jgi:hypothetical protein
MLVNLVARMSPSGQKYAFSVPLNQVWNVAVNRRSGSAVGFPVRFTCSAPNAEHPAEKPIGNDL